MTGGQRIADQLKAKADDKASAARLLVEVQHYYRPDATAKYNCEAIRDGLMAHGIRMVGEDGGGHRIAELAQKHRR